MIAGQLEEKMKQNNRKSILFVIALSIAAAFTFNKAEAQKSVIDAVVKSPNYTEFCSVVKTAGLNEMLRGAGPFTIFAPTNQAFQKLPLPEQNGMLGLPAKHDLTQVMIYHIIAGKLDMAALFKAISDGNGKNVIKTMNGGSLTATLEGSVIVLTDEKGAVARVSSEELKATNGIIHPID